jgi:hypothetical protein
VPSVRRAPLRAARNIKLGGASAGQQALAAGLCDEILIHLALSAGRRRRAVRRPRVGPEQGQPRASHAPANPAYQNAKQSSDKQNARIERDKALAGVIIALMKDDTELFKQFSDNPEFKRWLTDTVFSATYDRHTPGAP